MAAGGLTEGSGNTPSFGGGSGGGMMGGLGSLFDGISNSQMAGTKLWPQTDQGKSSSTSKTEMERLLDQLVTQVQQGRETQSGSVTALSEADQKVLTDSIAQITGMLSGSEPGVVDHAAVRESAVSQVMEAGMGDVISAGSDARAYAGTPQGTAAERLSSRAVVEGAGQEAQSRLTEYGQLQQALGQLTNILKGATTTTDVTTDTMQRGTESTATKETGTQETEGTEEFRSKPEGHVEKMFKGLKGKL